MKKKKTRNKERKKERKKETPMCRTATGEPKVPKKVLRDDQQCSHPSFVHIVKPQKGRFRLYKKE